MGTDERPPASGLMKRLQNRPQRFNLFQAISLLERSAPERADVGTGVGTDEAVQLHGEISLGFAPSDVTAVWAPDKAGEASGLRSPIMSLAGATGPLPTSLTEMLLFSRAQKNRAPLDFLDIFQHRWLGFLYRSRKKHHLGLEWRQADQNSPLARTLDALSGLGRAEGARGPAHETARLRYAGLQNAAPRSMANLLSMLSDQLALAVEGRQCVGSWQVLAAADTPPLGRAVLGQQAVLGRRVWDQTAGIELSIALASLERLPALLPGGAEHELIGWLVRRHAQRELNVQLVLKAGPQAVQALPRLGAIRLGWTSWMAGGAKNTNGHRAPLDAICVHIRAGNAHGASPA